MQNGTFGPARSFRRAGKAFAAPVIVAATLSLWAVLPSVAEAHAFTAALLVVGEDREARLADAVRGFLLAADERDGHAGETSDGHLGGVDVNVLPLPQEAAGSVTGLSGAPDPTPDIVVVLGDARSPDALAAVDPAASVIMVPGDLPDGWDGQGATEGFVGRYLRAYGTAPGEAAALGYHAARRIDAAVRPLDGVAPRADLEAALGRTEAGFQW
ncbi:MAG: hypothetical protein B7Z04_01770 [Rhodobacterales bacterium 32-66-9]|nr:MAG: hypothetical protein B7Z04_01770 [Rhodobacterales bacterium 32-66-9]